MVYIGIDPGARGGIAVIRNNGKAETYAFTKADDNIHITLDLPEDIDTTVTLEEFLEFCTGYGEKKCYIERVHSMPHDSHTRAFAFGENYGFIRGMLRAKGIVYEAVTPQKWKKFFGLSADKCESIRKAKELFPDVNLKRTPRCKVDHDGMAEALLIAEYGRMQNAG